MYPAKTYELRIDFPHDLGAASQTKELVKSWLNQHEIDSFVEGAIDGVDIDDEYGTNEGRDLYAEAGGNHSPLSIYKFDGESLSFLKARIEEAFGLHLKCSLHSHETKEWVDGWKDSFKPITTEKFFIYPPWYLGKAPKDHFQIEIEPAMAFGTGQHATTILCLRQIETFLSGDVNPSELVCADIGTGTGILAIGMAKLGCKNVLATDIDIDAVNAAKTNARLNKVTLNVVATSVPKDEGPRFDLVVANILSNVLLQLMGDLASITSDGGDLILSGLLEEHEAEIILAATPYGFKLKDCNRYQGWSCLQLTKHAKQLN